MFRFTLIQNLWIAKQSFDETKGDRSKNGKESKNILCRKIQLIPVGDKEEVNRGYKYLRDGMYSQNRAANLMISNLYTDAILKNTYNERTELKNVIEQSKEIYGKIQKASNNAGFQALKMLDFLNETRVSLNIQ